MENDGVNTQFLKRKKPCSLQRNVYNGMDMYTLCIHTLCMYSCACGGAQVKYIKGPSRRVTITSN